MSNKREIPEKYIDLEYQLLYETKIDQTFKIEKKNKRIHITHHKDREVKHLNVYLYVRVTRGIP